MLQFIRLEYHPKLLTCYNLYKILSPALGKCKLFENTNKTRREQGATRGEREKEREEKREQRHERNRSVTTMSTDELPYRPDYLSCAKHLHQLEPRIIR